MGRHVDPAHTAQWGAASVPSMTAAEMGEMGRCGDPAPMDAKDSMDARGHLLAETAFQRPFYLYRKFYARM